ncbi:MAG: hypothetical protein IJX17_00565 [Clostridia bacterium]|nr:hypothetical protein [Clostridia bacterium]
MANIRNNTLSKDKILSALCLIVFVLMFIFSCLSKSISFGAKIIGTFGAISYPVFLVLAFICLIKFLGFSYKRNLKATILFLCFVYCLLAIVHSIRTYSVLDAVASGLTFKNYITFSYSNLTLLGSIGCVICGAISYLLGGVGTIVVFVILATLFIGFFIDFELYGKYSEKHIKKLKTKKLREKVLKSDSNVGENGKPVYSFSNDIDKYSSDDVVAEITANVEDEKVGDKFYSQNDVVDEITDGKVYNFDENQNYLNNFGNFQTSYYQNEKLESNNYQSNASLFGKDAVKDEDSSYSSSSTMYQDSSYPDVYDLNEQRRQFLNDTYYGSSNNYSNNYSNNSEGENYSSLLSNYNTDNNYNYEQSNSGNQNNYSFDNSEIDSYESYKNQYGGVSLESSNDSYNDNNYNDNYSNNNYDDASVTNYYNDDNSSSNYSNYTSSNNSSSNSSSSSNDLDFLNIEMDSYNNSSINESKDKKTFNVDDQISKILNKDESLEDNYNSSYLSSNNSNNDISNIIKNDVNNNFIEKDTKSNNFDNSFNNTNNFEPVKEKDNLSDSLKMKIPAKDSQVKKFTNFDMGMRNIKYVHPKTSLLNPIIIDNGDYKEEQEQKAKELVEVIKAFNISVSVENIVRGPKITRYELSVPLGVSVKKIPSLELDIKKAMAAKTINIQAPIPGSKYVGIELENDTFTNVSIRELIESDAFQNAKEPLSIVIGKAISGEIVVKSIPKMVHMLIAGQTGSGKSVFIHTLIMSLIYKHGPEDVRLMLLDPKRVEFNMYNGIPHLLTPEVVLGTEKSVSALKWCVAEMDRRYELMSKAGYNHITSYNNSEFVKSGQLPKFPYIVIVVDEFAEIILENKKDAEPCIQRLTQLARACGMHLILATQRPSVNVISGVIKNNVPTRIAFSLSAAVDSKTIIDKVGAENLLGNGDMLFAPTGTSDMPRLQAAYCSEEEIKAVIDYNKKNNESFYDESVNDMINNAGKSGEQGGLMSDSEFSAQKERDPLFKVALKMFIQKGDASGSYLQRRLSVGYSRAAKIMDQLEDSGYIASANGSKVRKVLITPEQFRQEFGEDVEINGGSD